MIGADRDAVYDNVPFFWTAQYGRSLRYVGHAAKPDRVVIHGSTKKGLQSSWTAFFLDESEEKVVAVCTFQKDPQAAAALELFRLGALPSGKEVKKASEIDLAARLVEVTKK